MVKIKSLFIFSTFMAGTTFLHAQSTVREKDSVIMTEAIKPLLTQSGNSGEAPDWQVLGQEISTKYGDSYVDRSVTKAKIYYYYGRDWAQFSKALVHYTDAFEDKEDLKLMSKNAGMVLDHSQNADELKSALSWMKHAVDKEPSNASYKSTYDLLATKVKATAAKN